MVGGGAGGGVAAWCSRPCHTCSCVLCTMLRAACMLLSIWRVTCEVVCTRVTHSLGCAASQYSLTGFSCCPLPLPCFRRELCADTAEPQTCVAARAISPVAPASAFRLQLCYIIPASGSWLSMPFAPSAASVAFGQLLPARVDRDSAGLF